MKLNEWKAMNKPAAGSNTTSASASSTGFKKRFDKIINYYDQHLPAEVDYLMVNILTPGSLNFTENYSNGDKVNYDILIDDFDTVEWRIKIKVNGKLTNDHSGWGWRSLLSTLGTYIEVPGVGTSEYKDLLTEWVVMNNKNSSTSYKKRFEKLIKYHIDNASSELESITKKDIKDYNFHLGEHYNTGLSEFDREIVVAYDSNSDTFFIHIFVDNKEVESEQVESYSKLVKVLEPYMYLPDGGTPEYDDLLVEWVAVKNNSSTSPASFKNRLKKLYDYVVKYADKRFVERVELETLTDDTLRYIIYSTSLMSKVETRFIIRINPSTEAWNVRITGTAANENITGTGWEELLKNRHVDKSSREYSSLLTEWVVMKTSNNTSTPAPANKNSLWKTFTDAVIDYIDSIPELSDLKTSQYSEGSTGVWKVLYIYDKFPEGHDIRIRFNIETEDFEITTKYENFKPIKGYGFNSLMSTLNDIAFTIFELGSFDFLSLRETFSIADDFKVYENLWD